MPLVLVLNVLGFRLGAANENKIFRVVHAVSVVILLLLVSPFIKYHVNSGVVVATITYINARCIYLTLIIIYIRNVPASRKPLRDLFKCLDNIDLRLRDSFDVKIKDDESKWLVRVVLLLLFIGAFCSLAVEFLDDKMFNVGHFVQATLVFILSVKILFYCMLCASIKLRFRTLIKYLRDSKSKQGNAGKFVVTTTAGFEDMSQLREVSLIYDEVLEIISLMNESFATLLSFAFGEICAAGAASIYLTSDLRRTSEIIETSLPSAVALTNFFRLFAKCRAKASASVWLGVIESGRAGREVENTRGGWFRSHDLQRGLRKEAATLFSLGRKLQLCLHPSCAFHSGKEQLKASGMVQRLTKC